MMNNSDNMNHEEEECCFILIPDDEDASSDGINSSSASSSPHRSFGGGTVADDDDDDNREGQTLLLLTDNSHNNSNPLTKSSPTQGAEVVVEEVEQVVEEEASSHTLLNEEQNYYNDEEEEEDDYGEDYEIAELDLPYIPYNPTQQGQYHNQQHHTGQMTTTATTTTATHTYNYNASRKRTRNITQRGNIRALPSRRNLRFYNVLAQSPDFATPGLTLKDYQLHGLNWLRKNWYSNRNSILADEMGLGKTVQALSLLDYISNKYNVHGPFLIVVPLTTLTNWQREIDAWSHLNVLTIHLDPRELVDAQRAFRDSSINIILTTYEVLKRDRPFFLPKKWQVVIFDEAHRLKSTKSMTRQVAAKLKSQHKILLTGTPFQVHIEELFNLLSFIDSSTFSNTEELLHKFGAPQTEQQILELKQLISPYVLRRKKEEVLVDEISEKEEIIVELELTSTQKTLYRAIIEKKSEFLRREFKTVHAMTTVVTALKKCCNHPFLIPGVEESICKQNETARVEDIMVRSSSKLIFLDKLLTKLVVDGEKVLIFCQLLQMLSVLEDYLEFKAIGHERLDGSMTNEERTEKIDRFNNDPNCRVFLLSTRAGGFGINLTAANNVVIYDSDYNPFNDSQASARCHRIGQTKKVSIYRLISKDTYETVIFKTASKRLGLGEMVLGGATDNSEEGDTTVEEMESVLRYGVYHFLVNEDSSSRTGDDLLDENLSSILLRSKANSATTSEQNEKRSNVVSIFSSQADLTSPTQDASLIPPSSSATKSNSNTRSVYFAPKEKKGNTIDINDKDFWNKVFPEYADTSTLIYRLSSTEPFSHREKVQFMTRVRALVRDSLNMKNNKDGTMPNSNTAVPDKKLQEFTKLNLTEEKTSSSSMYSDHLKLRANVHTILLRMINGSHSSQFTPEELQFVKDSLSQFEGKSLRNRHIVAAPPPTITQTKPDLQQSKLVTYKPSPQSLITNMSSSSGTKRKIIGNVPIQANKKPKLDDTIVIPTRRAKKITRPVITLASSSHVQPQKNPSMISSLVVPKAKKTSTKKAARQPINFNLSQVETTDRESGRRTIQRIIPKSQIRTRSQAMLDKVNGTDTTDSDGMKNENASETVLVSTRKAHQPEKEVLCAGCSQVLKPDGPRCYRSSSFVNEYKIVIPTFDSSERGWVCNECYIKCFEYRKKKKQEEEEEKRRKRMKAKESLKPTKRSVFPKKSSLISLPSRVEPKKGSIIHMTSGSTSRVTISMVSPPNGNQQQRSNIIFTAKS